MLAILPSIFDLPKDLLFLEFPDDLKSQGFLDFFEKSQQLVCIGVDCIVGQMNNLLPLMC